MNATERKEAILKMLPDAKLLRRHAGRYEVELDSKHCLLVVNTVHGSVQFMAESGDADADIPALEGVDYCLMATGRDVDSLSAWLVPVPRLIAHIKKQHEAWLAEKPERSRDNRMRTVKPLDVYFADCQFNLETTSQRAPETMTPDQARQGLAVHFGVDPSKIRISVDV
ncbi:hypothetical protein [Leisingera methylohalidivorans]|uniref:Uncharacterized protein n=1 Tax=Leisingera methylohalidivorans DSM 14336 TaxID=999552 RepID=V9VZ64_9RHOB|nr:hypothetical protein [Leisingera methylohalidivorans]AHD03233.1 hypothetical protein METH_17195 [Leisingera methylohalidivorans DSM 14336]